MPPKARTAAAKPAEKVVPALTIQDLSEVSSPIGDENNPIGWLALIDEGKYAGKTVPTHLLPTHSVELKSANNPIARSFWFIYSPATQQAAFEGGAIDQYELDVILRKAAMAQITAKFGKQWGRNYGFIGSTTEKARPYDRRHRGMSLLPDTYGHTFSTVVLGQMVERNVLGDIIDPATTVLDSFQMYTHSKELNVTMDTDFELRVQLGSVFHSTAHRWANDAVAEAIGEMSIGSISAYIALVGNTEYPVQPHQLDLPQLASEIEAKMFFLASSQKSKVVMLDTSASSFKFVEGAVL